MQYDNFQRRCHRMNESSVGIGQEQNNIMVSDMYDAYPVRLSCGK